MVSVDSVESSPNAASVAIDGISPLRRERFSFEVWKNRPIDTDARRNRGICQSSKLPFEIKSRNF
jgi:hypothetical protein